METNIRTPLIDAFRRGGVPRDIRELAARGALTSRVEEQLALLALLVDDPDGDLASWAAATLQLVPRAAVTAVLERPDLAGETRVFFAEIGALIDRGREEEGASSPNAPEALEIADDEDDEQSALQRLAGMTVPQKINRAVKGTREERAILIRDSNRLVASAVLSSPKLTETEVEGIARMANVSDEILRIIAGRRNWMKNYGTMAAVVRNPKTPVTISMNLLGRLTDRDLRVLSTNRNIPDPLRIAARRRLVVEK